MKARRGRPARISRQDIAEAALTIGLDAATLPVVAERIGVDHSSLYRHIKSREDMLLAAADHAIASVDWNMPEHDWRAYLAATAKAAWDLYARYPGLAEAVRGLAATPSEVVAAFTRICRRLETFGFASDDAMLIVDSIMDMTCDSAVGWRHMRMDAGEGATVGVRIRQSWQSAAAANRDMTQHVAAMERIIAGDPESWWRRKLDILLDGAAARLPDPIGPTQNRMIKIHQ